MPTAILTFAAKVAFAVVTATGATAAAATAILYTTFAVTVAGSLYALQRVSKALGPKLPKSSRQTQGIEAAYSGTTEPRRVIYGQIRVGGMDAHPRWSSGASGEYLHITQAVAGHECEAITDVWFNNDQIPSASIGAVSGGPNDGLVSSGTYTNWAWIRRVLGTSSDGVDYILSTTFPSTIDANYKGAGIAKVYLRLKFNADIWRDGIPNPTYLVRGKKVYDPRSSTTAWSDNPALCLRDFLTDATYGFGVPAGEINDASFIAAANVCDTLVDIPPGPTTQAKRYTCNGIFYANADPLETIRQLCEAMLGRCVFRDGQWFAYAGAWDVPVATINASDWMRPQALQIQTTPDRADRYNAVRCWYVDPARNYQRVEALPQLNSTYETEDGGERIYVELDQPFCNAEYESQRKAKLYLRQSRNALTISGLLRPAFSGVAIWETVTVNLAEFGISSKAFRIVACDTNLDGSLAVVLREESSSDWSNILRADYDTAFTSGGTPSENVNSISPTGTYVPTTPAETAAGVTPASFFYREGDIRRYGAVVDGSANDAAAIQAAINVAQHSAGKCDVYIPGNTAVASTSLPLAITGGGVAIVGIDRQRSRITVTGVADNHLFTVTNAGNFSLRGVGLYGNSQASTYVRGFALYVVNSGGGTLSNFVVEECHLQNFKGDYWLCWNCTGTGPIENVTIRANTFKSLPGNCRDELNDSASAACIALIGSSTSSTALVRNAWIDDNHADCYYIKSFATAWANAERVWIRGNSIIDAGYALASGYGMDAIIVYDTSGGVTAPPDEVFIENNYISRPRDSGVYVVRARRVFIRQNTIVGQVYYDLGTGVPNAAIALNQPIFAEVSGNVITDSANAIGLAMNVSGGMVNLIENEMYDLKATSIPVWIVGGATAGQAERLVIRGNRIRSANSGHGIYLALNSTVGIKNVEIEENEVSSKTYGIYITKPTGFYCDYLSLSRNRLSDQSNIAMFVDALTTPRIVIDSNQFLGGWGANASLLYLAGCTRLVVTDNVFCNLTSGVGAAINTAGAQGTLAGCRFQNVAAANLYYAGASEELGVDTPTWTGAKDDYVENLNRSHITSPYDHVLMGWACDGSAWRELRAPTGTISGGGLSDGDKGDITVSSSGATWMIDNDVVTLAKLQNIATASFLGRATAGTGDPEVLTATQATALLNQFTATLKGLAPAPGSGLDVIWNLLTGAGSYQFMGHATFKQDGDYTLQEKDRWGVVRIGNLSANRQVTIPTNAAVPFPYANGNSGLDAEGGGTVILFPMYSSAGYRLTFHPDTGVTLRWNTGAGATSTGDCVCTNDALIRLAVLVKVDFNTWHLFVLTPGAP